MRAQRLRCITGRGLGSIAEYSMSRTRMLRMKEKTTVQRAHLPGNLWERAPNRAQPQHQRMSHGGGQYDKDLVANSYP